MRRVVAGVLVVLLEACTSSAWAQQVSPALLEAARQAYQQGQQSQPEILVPAQVQSQAPPANESEWDNLSQLQVGANIVIETMDNVRHSGRFVAYSDETISLREDKREVSYRAEEVLAVWLVGRPNRGKAAQLGFLIGFGTVLAIGLAHLADKDDDLSAAGQVLYSLGFGALAGAMGAGIGAAVAPRAKTLIYRAPPSPPSIPPQTSRREAR